MGAQKRKRATWLGVMSRPNEKTCPFCSIDPSSVVAGNELVFAIRDAYPVTPLHTLVLPPVGTCLGISTYIFLK